MGLLRFTDKGIYCEQANVYLDPWRKVDRAIVSHAHADHARWGMKSYMAHVDSEPIMRLRLGKDIALETRGYKDPFKINGVEFSFHPAGHIIGSAQIRVAYKGEVWVFSGDYKTEPDDLSVSFEPVPCHTFITESTFGLPVYKWTPAHETFDDINAWWRQNQSDGFASVLCGYSLGKAQRLLSGLDLSIGRVFTHGAIANVHAAFESHGITLPPTTPVSKEIDRNQYKGQLILTPSSALNTPWINQFKPYRTAMASGWMSLRGTKRRQHVDKGFALSDHADWEGLNATVRATGAERVFVTHGYQDVFAAWLTEQGLDARVAETEYSDDFEDQSSSSSKD